MKFKICKKIIAIIITLMIGISAFTTYSVFAVENGDDGQYELSVDFEQNPSNEKEFIVKLYMSDEDSVSSFQIGLDINVDQSVNPKFEFDQSLLSNEKLDKVNYDTNKTSDGFETKRIYAYYVGTKELNPQESNVITIGKLTFENADQPNTTVLIQDAGDFSTVETIGFNYTPLEIKKFETTLNKQSNPNPNNPDDPNASPGTSSGQNPGGSTSGDNNGNNNGSNNGNDNGGGNFVQKFINGLKTGANKSVTWAVITLAVLVIVAIVLAKKKGKIAKRGKHGK